MHRTAAAADRAIADSALYLLTSLLQVRERAADEVSRDIEMAKVEAERLLAEQVAWDMEVSWHAAHRSICGC